MSKYTAEDFANAQFAEHPDGEMATRSDPNDNESQWSTDGGDWYSDKEMTNNGWVPAPTKPTITRSQYDNAIDRLAVAPATYGFDYALEHFGIEIIPDPEPTNTERLEQLIRESGYEVFTSGFAADARELAEWLNNDGVTAPKED